MDVLGNNQFTFPYSRSKSRGWRKERSLCWGGTELLSAFLGSGPGTCELNPGRDFLFPPVHRRKKIMYTMWEYSGMSNSIGRLEFVVHNRLEGWGRKSFRGRAKRFL